MGKCTTVGITNQRLAAIDALITESNLTSKPGLAIGTTTTNVAYVEFIYRIAGVQYTASADAAGAAPGTDVIPQNTYGCVAIEINASGTTQAVGALKNSFGYNSAAEAIADLPEVESDQCRLGNVVVIRTAGAFTFGTTALDDGDTTVTYNDDLTGGETVATKPF